MRTHDIDQHVQKDWDGEGGGCSSRIFRVCSSTESQIYCQEAAGAGRLPRPTAQHKRQQADRRPTACRRRSAAARLQVCSRSPRRTKVSSGGAHGRSCLLRASLLQPAASFFVSLRAERTSMIAFTASTRSEPTTCSVTGFPASVL